MSNCFCFMKLICQCFILALSEFCTDYKIPTFLILVYFWTDKHPGQWILGGGWNNDFWGGDFPDASWLDDISPDNPVCFQTRESNLFWEATGLPADLFQLQVWLSRMDGHMGIANSLAMKIAGINRSTNDPIGGTIMRTAEGGNTTN